MFWNLRRKKQNYSRRWWRVSGLISVNILVWFFLPCRFSFSQSDFVSELINQNFKYFPQALHYDSGFIYDHIHFAPQGKKIGEYTSPTVIGLWMVLLTDIIVGDLKIDGFDSHQAREILSRVITSLEEIPKWEGLFYWYELKDKVVPTEDKAISAYDNGNLTISMAVAYSALSSSDNENDLTLAERIWNLIIAQRRGWRKFWDPGRNLLYGLFKNGRPVRNLWLDRFYTESRNAVLAGILVGDLTEKIWMNLLRPENCPVGKYRLSSGKIIRFFKPYQGAFQAWMSLLFIPEMELSPTLARMHYNYAQIQIDYALNSELPLLRSACADPYVEEKYFYEPCVGIINASEDWVRSDIGSAYATALLYPIYPEISLELFKIAIKKFPHILGPYGFWDSIGENGKISKVYLALDQLQLILSFLASKNQIYFMRFVDKIGKTEMVKALYLSVDKMLGSK